MKKKFKGLSPANTGPTIITPYGVYGGKSQMVNDAIESVTQSDRQFTSPSQRKRNLKVFEY